MNLDELLCLIAARQKEHVDILGDPHAYLNNFFSKHSKSPTLQCSLCITDFEMEQLYSEAYSLYENERYKDSAHHFRWLLLLNPFLEKYWMGHAASEHLQKNFEKALHSYAMVTLLNVHNPFPHWYAYQCYVQLNNRQDALLALRCALECTQRKKEFDALRQEIETILQSSWLKQNEC